MVYELTSRQQSRDNTPPDMFVYPLPVHIIICSYACLRLSSGRSPHLPCFQAILKTLDVDRKPASTLILQGRKPGCTRV
jgi:hypothetical protein